jgi:aryl-alcohol dehydrogenase-like predicted oxidoreductase
MVWAYGRGYGINDVRSAFETSLEAGINFFDTAEVYGWGKSERLLGEFLDHSPDRVVTATKFAPFPWRVTRGSLMSALKASLKRLGLKSVDLYQIHWPLQIMSIETMAGALAETVQGGFTRAVGVSNYNESKMRRMQAELAKFSIPLASNQVEYSLLNRNVEFNGLLQACRELGITLIAYSPLAKGVLTGKYSSQNPPPGIRGRQYNRTYLDKVRPLISLMREIGSAHDRKTPAQVALNWTICKGSLPIPGAKNLQQAQENTGALGWRLSSDEIIALDEASAKI